MMPTLDWFYLYQKLEKYKNFQFMNEFINFSMHLSKYKNLFHLILLKEINRIIIHHYSFSFLNFVHYDTFDFDKYFHPQSLIKNQFPPT